MIKRKFKSFSGEDIIRMRKFFRETQEEFAKPLYVSAYTVQSWELGRRNPSPHVCFLIAEREEEMLASIEHNRLNHSKGRATLKR